MKTALLILRRAFSLLTTEPAIVLRILLPVVLGFCFLLFMPVAWRASAGSVATTPAFWYLFPIAMVWGVVVVPACAVAFHRYALTGEKPTGLVPGLNTGRWLSYFGWAFLVGLLVVVVSLVLVIFAGFFLHAFANIWIASGLSFLMSWALQWLTLRVFLILPDTALHKSDFSISNSLDATRPVSRSLWVLALPLSIMPVIPGFFGTTGWFAMALSTAMTSANWIIVLAIATTLYGHLVENRPLEDA